MDRARTGCMVAALVLATLAGCGNDTAAVPAKLTESDESRSPAAAVIPPPDEAPSAEPMRQTRAVPQPLRMPLRHSDAPPAEPQVALAEVPQSSGESIVRILYGTNRRPTGKSFVTAPNEAYGAEIGELELGVCAVSIPPTHGYGQIERPSVWRFEFAEHPGRHVMLRQIARVDPGTFAGSLRAMTAQSRSREAFVFVHGYNNDFAEAARRTAQIKFDLDFDGPAILFSWPSEGAAGGYAADRRKIAPTLPKLTEFLTLVAEQSGAERIHVIAHSMGNEFATRSLAEISTTRNADLFDELILAAPDIDAAEFATTIAPYLRPACRRCTIYAADHDVALATSQRYHRKPRLGQAGRYLVSFPATPHINVVDASAVGFDLFNLGHADFGDDLLVDIRAVMSGLNPSRRKLVPHSLQAAWRFVPGSVRPVGFESPAEPPVPAPPAEMPDDSADDVDPSPEPIGFWAKLSGWWHG